MKPKLNINEDFICRLWEGGDTYYSGLVTDSGEDVEVLEHGARNYDSGPDYKNAKIRIGDKVFTGDIEVHRDFKNWAEHNHPKDRRYNQVILHVVMWDSVDRTPPKLRIKRELPSVILSNHLKSSIHDIWQDIISNPSGKFRLPCYEHNLSADNEIIINTLSRLSTERLQLKVNRIKNRIQELGSSNNRESLPVNKTVWEQALYEFIFEALGFSKNKEQMMKLASTVTLKLLGKYAGNDITKIQALLYGAAGFFFDIRSKDDYIDFVKEYWRSHENKLNLNRLQRSQWNFFGQRPQNYPTLRIAYGSQIIYRLLFNNFLKNLINLIGEGSSKKLFTGLSELLSPQKDKYWQNHYDLGKLSKNQNKLGGKQRITDIIINVVIPFALLYGETFNKKNIAQNTLNLYNELKIKPDNKIVRLMDTQLIKGRDITISTPANEQAVIQLYNFYCTREKCGKCEIGKSVLNNKGYDYKIIYY